MYSPPCVDTHATYQCSLCATGIGAGAGAAIFGYLAHTSTTKERTAFFSMFMAARQIGLILGEPLSGAL